MTILFPSITLLHDLFPQAKGDPQALLEEVRRYYTVKGIAPTVTPLGEGLQVELDLPAIEARTKAFREAVAHCEAGRLAKGRELLAALVAQEPQHSEYHRMLGQIAAELGEPDAAIDHLIDALRWDPKNTHALTMMGNLQARHHRDTATALRYYEAALAVDPRNHIAANNIAAQFLMTEELDLAEQWFEKAVAIEPAYPNSHHGLAVVAERKGDMDSALFAATEALRLNPARDELYRQSHGLARHAAHALVDGGQGAAVVRTLCDELQQAGGLPVRSVPDATIPTAARLEVAEVYGRTEHVVRYKPGYPCVEHLEVHELYHLRYILQARAADLNELFTSGPEHKAGFLKARAKDRAHLLKEGIREEAADRFLEGLFEGLNRQVYNAPIDLFIEYDLHRDHPAMRPYQFLSLERLLDEAVQSTTDKRILHLAPGDVVSKSKVYSLTLALLYKELYGVDRVPDMKPAALERQQAERLYAEFMEYRDDREPAEEYEVVRHWAEDLKLRPYFALVKEQAYRSTGHEPTPAGGPANVQDQLDGIEADPIGDYRKDPEAAAEMRTFQEQARAQGTNMAVVMFMVDALKFYQGQSKEAIKKSAFEIAMLGTQGIHPEKQGYHLASVPGTTFSGYHLLAYYYVSFKLVLPELLPDLQLPYDAEYAMAEQLFTATP